MKPSYAIVTLYCLHCGKQYQHIGFIQPNAGFCKDCAEPKRVEAIAKRYPDGRRVMKEAGR